MFTNTTLNTTTGVCYSCEHSKMDRFTLLALQQAYMDSTLLSFEGSVLQIPQYLHNMGGVIILLNSYLFRNTFTVEEDCKLKKAGSMVCLFLFYVYIWILKHPGEFS